MPYYEKLPCTINIVVIEVSVYPVSGYQKKVERLNRCLNPIRRADDDKFDLRLVSIAEDAVLGASINIETLFKAPLLELIIIEVYQ